MLMAHAPLLHAEKKTVEELRARADAASPNECVHVCMEAAKRLVEEGGQQVNDNETTALTMLSDATRYAENGAHASLSTHHSLKDTEIRLRELIRRLQSIKQTVDASQRGTIDQDVARLETLRDELLSTMFGNPKKDLENKLTEKKK
jgi:hypothetical protein